MRIYAFGNPIFDYYFGGGHTQSMNGMYRKAVL